LVIQLSKYSKKKSLTFYAMGEKTITCYAVFFYGLDAPFFFYFQRYGFGVVFFSQPLQILFVLDGIISAGGAT